MQEQRPCHIFEGLASGVCSKVFILLFTLVHEKAKRQGVEKQLIGSLNRYEVWLGQLPEPLPGLPFEPYLYNRPNHLATQRPENPVSVWLCETSTQQIHALLRADRRGPQVASLAHAPFGGLQFVPSVPADALVLLLSCLGRWCREQGGMRLLIKAPAAGYDQEKFDVGHRAYLSSGFVVAQIRTNHHIPVSERPFLVLISGAERRRLRKCLRAGFRAGLWPDPDPAEVYAFVRESRQQLGYSLPMSLAEFSHLLGELPDSTLVFAVWAGNKPISLTVAIQVSGRILYNFCPADDLAYRTFSPMVLLNASLYAYAQQHSFDTIDLGVSLDNGGNEKPSLARFKENLGGQPSVKITYEKIFTPG